MIKALLKQGLTVFFIIVPMFAAFGQNVLAVSVDSWPMFRHDPSHTGYTPFAGPTVGNELWNYTTDGIVESSPAVANGRVYVGSGPYDHRVYCFDASTGVKLWSYTTGDEIESSPAVAGGKVYIGSFDCRVYCLAASTGAKLWSYRTGSYVISSPTVAGGRVYVGSLDNKVYCLDGSTGAKIWSYTTDSWVESSPAVANGRVYVGSCDQMVYCLAASTGAKLWNYTTDDIVTSSPAVAGDRVYVGSGDKVYCLAASTGAKLWSYTTGSGVTSPAVAGGRVYIGSIDNKVYCLDGSTGAKIWSYTTGDRIESSPAVAGGRVYIGSSDSKVYCLAASTGAKLWSYATNGYISSSPAIANGRLYVGSEAGNGTIYCLGPSVSFSDGFESGSFSKWSGVVKTYGETASVIYGGTRHHGLRSARFTSNGGGGYEKAYCYKNIPGTSDIYVRGYFYVSKSGIVQTGDRFLFIVLKPVGATGAAFIGLKRNPTTGVVNWVFNCRNGASYPQPDKYSSYLNPHAGHWYCVELHLKMGVTEGYVQAWINGHYIGWTGYRNTAYYGSISQVEFGLPQVYNCGSTTVYGDCARISHTYIGPEY